MAEVAVIMVGDAAKLLAENEKLIRKQGQLEERIKKSQEASAKAAEAAKKEAEARAKAADQEKAAKDRAKAAAESKVKVEREEQRVMMQGKAITESLLTPQERFNQKAKEAVALKEKGAISAETLRRRYKALKQELREAELAQSRLNRGIGGSLSGAATSMAGIAASYLTVQGAISAVSSAMANQVELQREQLDLARQVARAQEGAIVNFTGLTPEQKQQALQQAASIQATTGFSSREAITEALGAAYSASGNIEVSTDAVDAATRITMQKPETLKGVASGLLDVMRATGTGDAEANLGFLMQAGSMARIEDMALLTKNMSPVIASAATIFAQGNAATVAKESAAMFSAFTRAGADKTGESGSTASIQFQQQLNEFFADLPNKAKAASDEIAKLEANAAITAREQLTINEAELRVREAESSLKSMRTPRTEEQQLEFARAQIKLEDARMDLSEARSKATLNSEEEKRLAELQRQRSELANVQAPKTPLEALKLLQTNMGLQQEFAAGLTGEARFVDSMRAALNPQSPVAQEIMGNAGAMEINRAPFDRAVGELTGLTPELALATASARSEGQSEFAKLADPEKEAIRTINEIRDRALKDATRSGMVGWYDYFISVGDSAIGSLQSSPQAAAQSASASIRSRVTELESGGVTAQERQIINNLLAQQKLINEVMEGLKKATESLNNAGNRLGRNQPGMTPAARNQINQGGGF